MHVEFQFEIGQFIQMRGCKDHKFLIVERVAQECPGGIQKYYTCRGIVTHKEHWAKESQAYTVDYQRVNEVEMEPYVELVEEQNENA